MKKITLVILAAFLTLNCSKDDSFNEEEMHLELHSSRKITALQSKVNYEIIDNESKIIGELSLYHDETTIYMICKTNEKNTLLKTDLFFGTFLSIHNIIEESNEIPSYTFKTKTLQTENIFRIEKNDLNFDKNGCIYVATHLKFTTSNSEATHSAKAVSQVLPGSKKLPYFLYCIN